MMDIRKILDSWSLGSIKNIKKAKMGVVNHNWIIETSSGNYVLRILPKGKKLKDLMFELKYIDILSKEGFGYQLPYALKTKKGDEIIKSGENYIWLYRFIEGHVKNSFGEEELKEMGKMMANYHRILEKISLKNGAGKSKPYVKDLILTDNLKGKTVGQVCRKDVIFVDSDKPLDDLLNAVKKEKHHMFIVMGKFGSIEGLVTIEDVVEEIIGEEIVDEYDTVADLRAEAKKKLKNRSINMA